MAHELHKITPEELRAARKAGYKGKKPKKPKANASLSVLEKYVVRYNSWVKWAKHTLAEHRVKIKRNEERKKLLEKIRKA